MGAFHYFIILLCFIFALTISQPVLGQQLPGSADPGRIAPDPDRLLPEVDEAPEIELPDGRTYQPDQPARAEDITFKLEGVRLEGITAFDSGAFRDIYSKAVGQTISLARIYDFAGRITQRYQTRGYFLSRAFVPAQTIENGQVTIRVIEGYIDHVKIRGLIKDNHIIKELRRRITGMKPVVMKELENALLLLNKLPGYNFRTVMEAGDREGGVDLILKKQETPASASLAFNNHGSRFAGPGQAQFAYRDSLFAFTRTTVSGLANLPQGNEFWALSLRHQIQIGPELQLDLEVSGSRSDPGFTLAPADLESESLSWSAGLTRQLILQRGKDLTAGLALAYRDSNTDILNIPVTRDRIRAVRAKLDYRGSGPLSGFHTLNLKLSRGLKGLGANDESDTQVSRTAAEPDFTHATIDWSQQRFVFHGLVLNTRIKGQLASKALPSSEEFGFGGARLGRGYDASEIVGDDGIAGSVELHWRGMKKAGPFELTPFVFYDIGKVWNKDAGQVNNVSAASTGIGLDINTLHSLSSSIIVALPLTKDIATPPKGNNGSNPKLLFELSIDF